MDDALGTTAECASASQELFLNLLALLTSYASGGVECIKLLVTKLFRAFISGDNFTPDVLGRVNSEVSCVIYIPNYRCGASVTK